METETELSMAEDERRALLTEDEAAILRGEKDVSEKYYYVVVTRARKKIQRLADDDLDALDHHDSLGDELREAVCKE